MGFEEVPHTADCAIRVWAADIGSLFAEAARGMNSVSGAQLGPWPRIRRIIALHAADLEGLLVAFLTELVIAQEQESLGFDQFELEFSEDRLKGILWGSALSSLTKPIKAVTYHNLLIAQTARGHETEIVFDV